MFGSILSDWALGYLENRAVYDVQIFTVYNDIETIENLPKTDYGFVDEFLKQNGYYLKEILSKYNNRKIKNVLTLT